MGFLDKVGSKLGSSVKSLTTNPGRWAENFAMSSNPVGLSLGQFDKWTGGTGDFRSSMGNPYVQAGAGVTASFAGAPWYAGMGLGGGMSALGGGNTGENVRGAQMGGLGQAGGNVTQAGYGGLVSRVGTTPPVETYGMSTDPTAYDAGGYPITTESSIAAETGVGVGPGGYPISVDPAGAQMATESYYPSVPGGRQAARGGPSAAPAGGGGLGGGGGRISPLALMGAKTGLGYLSNMQAQQALEPELEERRRAMERIRRLQDNPALAYRNDPALSAMRSRALGATGARYRAKFGGGEGGALARDLYRTGAATDIAAMNQSLAGEYQMLGATQPAVSQNLGAGGTGLGALTGPATGAMTDYALLQFMGAL